MFDKFDFSVLDNPEFKEDAVREELIVPILARLGYSATGEHQIIRSRSLTHPFVHIGTKQYKVNIIPDYLLVPDKKVSWVLDAKAPGENIRNGKNVEQAYSYAIHKDVRAQLYALCNGRELVVFHISHEEPLLAISTEKIDAEWKSVKNLLCPLAFTNPTALKMLSDFGLSMYKLGLGSEKDMFFPALALHHIAKESDDHFIITSNFEFGEAYCASFDADKETFETVLAAMGEERAAVVRDALSRMPYQIHFNRGERPEITLQAEMGTIIHKNKNESYLPLKLLSAQ